MNQPRILLKNDGNEHEHQNNNLGASKMRERASKDEVKEKVETLVFAFIHIINMNNTKMMVICK